MSEDYMTTIKFLWGDVEFLYMPLAEVNRMFGPLSSDGTTLVNPKFVSPIDSRFRKYLEDDKKADFEFDGDVSDWRAVLLEISIGQRFAALETKLSGQLDVIVTHVKRIRCDLETILDPQRGGIPDDSKN